MSIFIPISILVFALCYTIAQAGMLVAACSAYTRQTKVTISVWGCLFADAFLVTAAAITGSFV